MKNIKITSEYTGERLDKFLLSRMSGVSRSQIQKSIKSGQITVNGKPATPHRFLKEGDVVDNRKTENNKQKTADSSSMNAKKFMVPIISETDEYIIVNKPAGIAVHGAPHMNEVTLAEIMIAKHPEIAKVGPDPDRPGIVHRLDKDVSGLMVIARSEASYENLHRQFKARTIEKKYYVLVYGKIIKEEGVIDFPIDRASKGFKMAAKAANQAGKRALTEFKIIRKYINFTLAEAKIITGRTHQIRVHFSAFGYPVVGDNLYGTAKTKLKNKELALGRIMLVSTELAFIDLGGETKSFKINLPGEFEELLEKIK
jgi:23S rRNA pseudouridine1911/1915/1917 synthase